MVGGLTGLYGTRKMDGTAVKQQLHTICRKIGAANRAEAVAIALRKQLIKL